MGYWNDKESQMNGTYTPSDPNTLQANFYSPKRKNSVFAREINPEFITWQNNYRKAAKNKFYKQGGTMTRINYFQQGGAAPQQQNMQQQVVALVQAAMQGDQKATQTVNQIMEAAKQGDQQAMQVAQMIQQVAQQMKTSAKWGAKLQYVRSLKYAKGGKTCSACMEKGGSAKKTKSVKTVAKKDVDNETYKKLSTWERGEIDVNHDTYATSDNKDGSFNTKHKLTGQDSITINKKHMSPQMIKRYSEKKECGGKAKKRYFGGWL